MHYAIVVMISYGMDAMKSALTSLTQAKQLTENLQTTEQANSARPLLANINAEIKAIKTARDFKP